MSSEDSRSADWRSDPVSERQRSFLEDHGCEVPDTKGEASDLISEIYRKRDPATEGQRRRLEFYGIEGEFSKKEASELIEINKPLHDEEEYQRWKKGQLGKTGEKFSGCWKGMILAFRVILGIFLALLAAAAATKTWWAFAMFLISAMFMFPFFSKKISGGILVKGPLCFSFFLGGIYFLADSSAQKFTTPSSPAPVLMVPKNAETPKKQTPEIDWQKLREEFSMELKNGGGSLSKLNNIQIKMDQKESVITIVLTDEEFKSLSSSVSKKDIIDVVLQGLVILQVKFEKERGLPVEQKLFCVHLHLAEPGIAKKVRYRKLGMAYYDENTDSVKIKY